MSAQGEIVRKALSWLKTRNKSVSKHIQYHNSHLEEVAVTRPWLIRKALHTVTRGGDRVAKDLIERTLRNPDSFERQANGMYKFVREFGRQVGKHPGQTAFCVIVRASGYVRTAFPVAGAASIAVLAVLEAKIIEAIDGMEMIYTTYQKEKAQKPQDFSLTVVEIVTALIPYVDLSPATANEDEALYLSQSRYIQMMTGQYISAMEEIERRSFGAAERRAARDVFLDGLTGVAAPYV